MVSSSVGEHLHKLLRRGRLVEISKGQVIQSSDGIQTINLVTAGFIKNYLISNDGTQSIQSIYGKGDIFSLTFIYKILFDQDIYEGPEVYHYEAMSASKIYSIDGSTLKKAIVVDPTLYSDILLIAGRRLQSNIQELENLSLKNSYKRVAHQLLFFAREFGQTTNHEIRILIPLTHETLAHTLSLARETVSQCIIQLRDEKLIKTGKFITVLDINKLERQAYS